MLGKKWLKIAACVVAAAACAVSEPVHTGEANDGFMGGRGHNLMPLKSKQVSMVSEDVELTYIDRQWHVDAVYVFHNSSAGAASIQMGFPEYRCDPDKGFCEDEFHFDQMRTEVRGQQVEMRTGRVSPDHEWANGLGTVWLFDVTFAPLESVTIRHTYQVPTGGMSDGSFDHYYVTGTGNLWNGPIGSARFRVRLPLNTAELDEQAMLTAGLRRTDRRPVEASGRRLTEVVYEARDWTPPGHVAVRFRAGYPSHWPTRWDTGRDYGDEWLAGGPARAGLPDAELCTDFHSVWELATYQRGRETLLSAATDSIAPGQNSAWICTNQMFAVYGRRFRDERLNRYFYGEDGWVPGEWPYGYMEPNPDFDSSLLTRSDWEAIKFFGRLAGESAARDEPAEHVTSRTGARPLYPRWWLIRPE